jgi:hypothetical protein
MSIDEMVLREEIAQQIERGAEPLFPPVDEVEEAVIEALTWAAKTARGEDNYMTKHMQNEITLTPEEMKNLYGVYSLEDLDRID